MKTKRKLTPEQIAARDQYRLDMSRPIYLHVCKDGTVSYRLPREKVFNGRALPVFTVDFEEQAIAIQVRFCRRQWADHPQMKPGAGWYRLNEFSGELDDLDRVRVMFRQFWDEHLAHPQHNEHVAAYEREMSDRSDQYWLSNGGTVVAECGTILEGPEM